MAQTVIAVFKSRDNADSAVDELEKAGFDAKDISIIMKDEEGRTVETNGNPVVDGTVSGATTGAVLGGLAGLLIGIGAIAIPGIGGLLIGGPLAAALGATGAAATTVSGAVTGALAGGLVGALVSLGIPEEEAVEYETRIKEGAILIAVPVSDENDAKVRGILEANDADKVRSVEAKG